MKKTTHKFLKKIVDLKNNFLIRANLTEHTFMILIAILVGSLAGFASIIIRQLIHFISKISYLGNGTVLERIIDAPWYVILLIPTIGGIIVGPLIYFFAPEAKGHGVPEVMQAILLKNGKIRPRVALIKALASAITIGTGGSVGREGPIIQIGSSLGSTIAQFFKVPSNRMKTLVASGAAAGIAAAFNAPIAGALFALEIILMDFAVAQFSPIVIASVIATVISRAFEGDFAAFIVPKYQLVSPIELVFYVVLGVLAGIISYLFIKTLYYSEESFEKFSKVPEYLKPVIGGIGIGLIGLFAPQVMGVGYDTINSALNGNLIWQAALAFLLIKIFATALTLGSGGSGGIFAPSLFMGATLGYFFGDLVNQFFPAISASPGAYALVAMGGMVAGTTRAPITAIIIVFELTNDYHIILPLMITGIIATIVSSAFSRESIYTLKLVRRGLSIKEGSEVNVMKSIEVESVYQKNYQAIHANDNFRKVTNKIIQTRGREFPVTDNNENLIGVISVKTVKDFILDNEDLTNVLVADDIVERDFEVVTPDDNCQTALEIMRKYDFETLPVVSSENNKKLVGVIMIKDIQDAYHKTIEQLDIADSLATSIRMTDQTDELHFLEGYSMLQIKIPKSFFGRSIKELNIRAIYGVDILSIRNDNAKHTLNAIPSPDYIFKENDSIIVAGEVKNINIIKNLD